ncbi:Probable calcium-binding protein CML16 [Linum grandiflorum]
MAKMGHPHSYKEFSEMTSHANTNGDGILSFHEFANILARFIANFVGVAV